MSVYEDEDLMGVDAPSWKGSYAAVPASVTLARSGVSAFASSCGAEGVRLDAIRLAVSEALTNAIVHAYARNSGGRVDVASWLAGDHLWVRIADEGGGMRATPEHVGMGLGLRLISQVTDHFELADRSGGGTELRMCFGLMTGGRPQAAGLSAVAPG